MIVKFKIVEGATQILPSYQTPGAACFDFHSLDRGVVKPKESTIVRTGLEVELEPGYVLLVHSRSGHGFKYGVRLANSTGIIDSDYRGEICIALHNDSESDFEFEVGDRIAQGMVIHAPQAQIVLVDNLSDTERGSGGFGSTGK